MSPELGTALASRPDVEREAEIPPYTVFRLKDPGPGYVEPLAFAPVRAEPMGWRDASYRWFSRKPANRALLVFTHDPRFDLALRITSYNVCYTKLLRSAGPCGWGSRRRSCRRRR